MLRKVPNGVPGDLVAWFLKEYNSLNHVHAQTLFRTLRQYNLRLDFRTESSKLNETVLLGITELNRSLYALNPAEVVDSLSYLADIKSQGFAVSDIEDLVFAGVKSLNNLDGRKLSVFLASLVKLKDRNLSEVVTVIANIFQTYPDRVSTLSRRDIILLISNSVKSIPSCRGSEDVRSVNLLVKSLLHNYGGSKKFQDSAMLLCALGKLRRANSTLNFDVCYIDSIVPKLLPSLHLHAGSKSALLCSLWGLSLFEFKSQPLLIELYRQVHVRDDWTLNESCFLFYLFQTTSGINDDTIRSSLIFRLSMPNSTLSHINILNVLMGFRTFSMDNNEIVELYLDRFLYLETTKFSTDKLLTGLSLAIELDDRENSSGIENMINESVSRISGMKFNQVVRLFSILPERKFENEIVTRLKRKETLPVSDLILLAKSINVSPNLKSRVVHLLVCSIENRYIPTPTLLSHLPLMSRLGVFSKLSNQKKLFQMANSAQREGVSIPKNLVKSHRDIDASKRLVWLDRETIEKDILSESNAEAKKNLAIQEALYEDLVV